MVYIVLVVCKYDVIGLLGYNSCVYVIIWGLCCIIM